MKNLFFLLCSITFLFTLPVAHALETGIATDANLQELVKTAPTYLQTPDGSRLLLKEEDIVDSLSVDSQNTVLFPRINTDILLKNLYSEYFPAPQVLNVQVTSTGIQMPKTAHTIGYEVDHILLERLLLDTLFSSDRGSTILVVPVRSVAPKILFKDEDGDPIDLDVVAHGTSDFSGSSQARVHNIQTAMTHFQGQQILPGAEFSFNDLLGEVDGSTGYKKELVIKGDRTIPDYGGGVCQVSSTVYRAALAAGFPITERKPHSYAVSYYTPWGSDATIYPGVVDLRFVNDLPTPVYLHLYIEGDILHTLLYGTSDGRTVTLSGPNVYGHRSAPEPTVQYVSHLAPGKRVWKEYGHNGFSSWWERSITSATGVTMTEKINSVYEPRGGFVQEGKAEVPLQEE